MKARTSGFSARFMTLSTLGLIAVTIASPAAMASKARLRALSQSTEGSLYIKDNRNIFLNPATVNELKHTANFEWGGTASPPATPNAEGGAIYNVDRYNVGLQIGRAGDATQEMIAANGGYFLPQNAIDAIVGGDNGAMKWGGGIHYARSENNTTNNPKNKAREFGISGGILQDKISAYAKLELFAESTTDLAGGGTRKYDGKLGGEIGGKYDLDSIQAVGGALSRRSFGIDNGAGVKGDVVDQRLRVDYFRLLNTGRDTTSWFALAGLAYTTLEATYSGGAPADKATLFFSPVGVAVEHRALTWLTLRASVSQNLLLDQAKTSTGGVDVETANLEDTTVAAGFTGHVSDNMQIDATFEGADNGSGKINAAALAANVSFVYNF